MHFPSALAALNAKLFYKRRRDMSDENPWGPPEGSPERNYPLSVTCVSLTDDIQRLLGALGSWLKWSSRAQGF